MSSRVGTPFYISPQVLEGNYYCSCDIWSAGVMLYIMLSGCPPFFGQTDAELLQRIRAGHFTFP